MGVYRPQIQILNRMSIDVDDMSWLKMIIIRHATSEGNQAGRMMGHKEDHLSARGITQTKQLARKLFENHYAPTAVYSSPLMRASQTATLLLASFFWGTSDSPGVSENNAIVSSEDLEDLEAYLKTLSAQIHYCDDLKEFQNGVFQGLTWLEAQKRYPQLCHTLETSRDWIQIPEAESLQSGRLRARRFIQHVLRHHANGDIVWIISHEWLMQHLIGELLGCDRTWGLFIPNTSVFEFWLDRRQWLTLGKNRWNSALWQIRQFNDTRHLHPSC